MRDVSARYNLPVDPDATVEDLPIGAQQRVEIVKALTRNVDLLILDEPTAVLTPQETDDLLEVMRGLRDAGKSIVFITHKLREVKAIADRITVLRGGRVIGTATPDAGSDALASMMVGRSVRLTVDKTPASRARRCSSLAGVTVADDRGHLAVNGVDLEVRAGEVLGIAGVQGNGQTELVEAIMGLRPLVRGEITLDGRVARRRPTRPRVLAAGVGYIPEDRSDRRPGQGLLRGRLADAGHATPPAVLVRDRAAPPRDRRQRAATGSPSSTSVPRRRRPPSVRSPAATSRRSIVAREMSRPLKLLVAAQPTRGVDVGSTEFIHARVIAERDRGTAVLLVSSELDEVLALADRIAVIYRGRILGDRRRRTPRGPARPADGRRHVDSPRRDR